MYCNMYIYNIYFYVYIIYFLLYYILDNCEKCATKCLTFVDQT